MRKELLNNGNLVVTDESDMAPADGNIVTFKDKKGLFLTVRYDGEKFAVTSTCPMGLEPGGTSVRVVIEKAVQK